MFDLDQHLARGIVAFSVGAASSWEEVSVYGPGPVVDMGGGLLRTWYEGVATGNILAVGVADSYDRGRTWTKYGSNPVLQSSGAIENNEISPSMVAWDTDENLLKMWFHAGNDPPGSLGRYIGLATATVADGGFNWTRVGGAGTPVLSKGTSGAWDDKWVADCKVIRTSATNRTMYYGGVNVAATERKIGIATSTDMGYTWAKYGSNPVFSKAGSGWDSGGIQAFCPVVVNGEWHAWYIGVDGSGLGGIGHATSSDGGFTWVRSSKNPVLDSVGRTLNNDNAVAAIHAWMDDDSTLKIMRGSYLESPSVKREKRVDVLIPPRYPA